ncbi:hypothetical protein GGP41_008534 [Bipolaris sorokiniana]|uniref:Uncharacterized protein n=1 Tax=Cochliobolus sativus TaxID=45130 RepID=A0A8H5ZB66_COCSA|nr:hypothetical protein GGP41_008534 [Bipolaris sorokiniana]
MTERTAAVASGTWSWAEEVPWGADSPGTAANGAVRRCLLTPDKGSRSQPFKRPQDCWPTPRFPIDGRRCNWGAAIQSKADISASVCWAAHLFPTEPYTQRPSSSRSFPHHVPTAGLLQAALETLNRVQAHGVAQHRH